jgi:hypothetical protein
MSNTNLNDALKMVSELSANMDQLLKVQTDVIKTLPPEYQSELTFALKDMRAIKKAVKNGDIDKLNELNKRYANTNNSK